MSETVCKACSGQWPRTDHFIVDLGLSMAYLHEDQFFPGWTVVVFKRHATELFHLAPTERIQLMEEVSRAARVLAETFEAKKINYELLGNQLPHIHWHVIPRLASDPAPLEPVWRVQHDPVQPPGSDLRERIQRISDGIAKPR
jgi:diadenosine tetraphosphate (Ap4A) HIT family hydrolase